MPKELVGICTTFLVRYSKMNDLAGRQKGRMFKELPMVSIIMLNYNGKRFLDGCLSSLSRINYPKSCYEVIMVDNGSLDGSVGYVRKNFPWVKILVLNGNYGYTGGNNRGVDVAKGDFIVFLNNDTVVDKEWLMELVNVMLLDDKIAICGSKVIAMDNPHNVQYAGGFLNLVGGALFYPFHGQKLRHAFYLVGSIHGASFLMKKVIFKKIGAFDESFFMYSDENDLCLRAWIQDYHVGYSPYSIVYHYGGGTAGTLNVKKSSILHERLKSSLRIYYGNRNSIASVIKNFQIQNIFLGITFSYLYLLFQLILLLRIKSSEVKFLVKAGFWPIKNLKKIWKKRLIVQKGRKINDQTLIRWKLLLSITDMLTLILVGPNRVNLTESLR